MAIYFTPTGDAAEDKRIWRLHASVPHAVITDRTGMEVKPIRHADDGPYNVYVVAPRSRWTFELPGLSVHVRKGHGHDGEHPGPLPQIALPSSHDGGSPSSNLLYWNN